MVCGAALGVRKGPCSSAILVDHHLVGRAHPCVLRTRARTGTQCKCAQCECAHERAHTPSLAAWRAAGTSSVTGRPPRVLYTIPSGQNPTGAVMGEARKREIYEVRACARARVEVHVRACVRARGRVCERVSMRVCKGGLHRGAAV